MMKKVFLCVLCVALMGIAAYAYAQETDEKAAPATVEAVAAPMSDEVSVEAPQAEETPQDVGICPVMGGPASPEYSTEYEGKTYYFCCTDCIKAFKANPEQYIKKDGETEEPQKM